MRDKACIGNTSLVAIGPLAGLDLQVWPVLFEGCEI